MFIKMAPESVEPIFLALFHAEMGHVFLFHVTEHITLLLWIELNLTNLL